MTALFMLLLLSHVLADFVLQTNAIFKFKVKSFWGIVVHALIFLAVAMLMTMPLAIENGQFFAWLVVVSISHIIIDKVKLVFSHNIIQKELIYFVLDQLLHILAIATIYFFPLSLVQAQMGTNMLFKSLAAFFPSLDWYRFVYGAFILSLVVYVTYALEVILFYYDRTVNDSLKFLIRHKWAMFYRTATLLLLISPLVLIGVACIFGRYFFDKWRLVYDKRRYMLESCFVVLLAIIYYIVQRGSL